MKHIILLIFIFAVSHSFLGCSRTASIFSGDDGKQEFEEKVTSQISPKWFARATPERFVLRERDHSVPVHHFFDTRPGISSKSQSLNYIIETPAGSSHQFMVDLRSGRHYLNQKYCKESDHSTKSGEDILTPPFHIGIVPRVFDQLGSAQKIFVFDDSEVGEFKERFFSSKIVGGFVLGECLSGKCTMQSDWSSRLVLIGVNEGSKKYKKITNIEELKQVVDWPKVEAFIRNGFGSIQVGATFYPSFRIGAMLSSSRFLEYFKAKSLFFTLKKMTTLKKSCYKLYDHVWQKLGKDTTLETKLRKAKDLASQAKILSQIKKSRSGLYNIRFAKVFSEHHKNYLNCDSLVYSSNINQSSERKWFFSFYSMVNILYGKNYYYDCNRNIWRKSSIRSKVELDKTIKTAFRQCSIRDIDKSFSEGKVLLNNLRLGNQKSYRFIDYDNNEFGTHNKIYSWVPIPGKRLECNKGKEYFNRTELFPEDVILPKRNFKTFDKGEVIF